MVTTGQDTEGVIRRYVDALNARDLEEFAEEYFAHVPRTWHDRLPFHYAGALLEVAHGFFRRQAPDWPGRIAGLVEEARDSLAGKVW
jgi:hypothetical protein